MIVPDWLHRQAAVRPQHPALVVDGDRLTFAELDARVDALARRIAPLGARRVGVCQPNGVALVEMIHAVPRAGASLVLLDPRLTAAERDAHAARAAVDVVVQPDHLGAPGPACEPLLALDAPHNVVFTSGTSGGAKPVVLTAGNHLWSAVGSAARLGAHAGDRWLACMPLWHVGGLAIVMRAAIHGATVVLHAGFDADAVVRALHDDRITLLSLVPTALGRVRSATPPPALRCVLVGGAAASPALLREAHANGWPVAPTYGCTEAASQVATAMPGTYDGVGRPLLPTRVRIGAGDVIEISGPTVAPGYLEPDGTLRPLAHDGWFRTGDVGRLTPDGALAVLGRRDDVIVTGGENVAPTEVEAVLSALPGVAEVAVAGIADPEWGQAVAAWVVPVAGTTPSLDGLRRDARALLASYKLPKRLFVVDALPRTAAGKIRRTALRAPHGE